MNAGLVRVPVRWAGPLVAAMAAAFLLRGSRPFDAWIADLRRLLLEPSYRGSAITMAMLLSVARDARRAPLVRVAAVIAVTANEEVRSEVLALARATAEPSLRAVFERAARDGSIEARQVEEIEDRRS